MRARLATLGMCLWLAAGPSADGDAPGRPTAAGKPGAPAALEIVSSGLPDGAGRFVVEVRVTAQAAHERLALAAWGAPGVILDEAPSAGLGAGEAGRTVGVRLAGSWTGEGPPRVYVGVELDSAGRTSTRSLAIPVSRADYRPTARGRLDAAEGVLVFRVE